MKKFLGMLVLLFFFYFLFQVTFIYLEGSHEILYTINVDGSEAEIKENLNAGENGDRDSYSLLININDDEYSILTFNDFHRSSEVIKKIKYIKAEDYSCLFVKYRGDLILHDVICRNKDNTRYYHTISNPSEELEKFVKSLEDEGYKASKWENSYSTNDKDEASHVDNMVENHYVGLSNNNGFFRINKIDGITNVNVSTSSKNLLKAFVDDKYIMYEYERPDILKFFVNNMKDRGMSSFSKEIKISEESYVLGTYKSSVYFYDPKAKIEYDVDYTVDTILEVGNEATGIMYYDNGKFKRVSVNDVDSIKFGTEYVNDLEDEKYIKIDKRGHNNGYYYFYKDNGSSYDVYRADIMYKDKLMYLFTTTNIDKIVYLDNHIYYTYKKDILYYNDLTGIKTIVTSLDGVVDDNAILGVYED